MRSEMTCERVQEEQSSKMPGLIILGSMRVQLLIMRHRNFEYRIFLGPQPTGVDQLNWDSQWPPNLASA